MKKIILLNLIACLCLLIITGCLNDKKITFDTNGGKFKDNSTVKYMQWSDYYSGFTSECPNEFTFRLICDNYPNRDGYFFVDWKTNPDGTGLSYTSSGLSPSDYVFYAKWGSESEGYIISFDTKGGQPVQDMTMIMPNTTISLPNAATMTREGYAFLGWIDAQLSYRRPLHVEHYQLSYYPIQSIVLSAVWYKNPKTINDTCTVKFDPNGGRLDDPSFSSKQVKCGDTIQFPLAYHDDFSLFGWYSYGYSGAECGYPGNYPIFDDIIFYAIWDVE